MTFYPFLVVERALMVNDKDIPLLTVWLDFIQFLGAVCDRMPKKVRFTLSRRVYDLALEVAELIVDAKYSQVDSKCINKMNKSVTKIRLLLRVAYDFQMIKRFLFPTAEIQHVARRILIFIRSLSLYTNKAVLFSYLR